MSDWIDTLAALQASGVPAVIVSVVGTRGSVPRAAGTHMIVTRDAVHATIGGGHLEYQAIGIARDMLDGMRPQERLRRFPLGASLGQCCGGVVNLLFEPLIRSADWITHATALRRARTAFVTAVPTTGDASVDRLIVTADAVFGAADDPHGAVVARARALLRSGDSAQLAPIGDDVDSPRWFFEPVRDDRFDIVLFGAGHVGRALVKLFTDLPCRVTWIDARDDEFPRDVPPNVEVVWSDAPEADVDAAPPGAYFLVMTHDHAQDERISERILRRDDFAYFGLIGSRSKRRQFEQRMARRGMPPERFAAMTCPIGLPGIDGKEPAVIAVAVVAQILRIRSAAASALTPALRDASLTPAPSRVAGEGEQA